MATGPTSAQAARVKPLGEYDHDYSADDTGPGWVSFAGAMMLIIGALNVMYGIAAIDNSKFFRHDVAYILGDLKTWGWFLVIVGAIQFCAAFGIFAGNQLARWIGVATAAGNAVLQILFLPSYPFLSVTLFAADMLILYALIAFGGHKASMAR
jgi:hypothetical protein